MKQHEIFHHYFKIKKQKHTCFCVNVQTDVKQNVLGLYYIKVTGTKKLPKNWENRTRYHLSKCDFKKIIIGGLGMPYYPVSEPPVKSLQTVVPDSMGYELHSALMRLKDEIGNVNTYVCRHMGYKSHEELAAVLSAEQVDAVALAIYNIENRNEATIIGDQTGIGKGRIAASIIRTYVLKGFKPFFLTEKPNLFSDMYRDLKAIGSENLKPFIVNGKDEKTTIQDEDGNVIYEPHPKNIQENYFNKGTIPSDCNFVMATYSQFASKKPTIKQSFLLQFCQNNIFILDESHVAGGDPDVSATAKFFNSVVEKSKGGLFSSATFAKRPDNMPLYAIKTCIGEASMTKEGLINAIQSGGVALQEIISANLVAEGQMVRRERSFVGVKVNYIYLNREGRENFGVQDLKLKHWKIADQITEVLRDIVNFEKKYITEAVNQLDDIAKSEMAQVEKTKGTSELGVKQSPFFSKLFNVVNQMLFAIKAEAATERAIQRLKEGKKPVIAFASTMGSFLADMENEYGFPVQDGDIINADFNLVLKKGLDNCFKITEIKARGKRQKKKLELHSLGVQAVSEYNHIVQKIKKISSGISISPIDNVKSILAHAGYTCAEVTGRELEIEFSKSGGLTGLVKKRKKENTVDAFRKFNNNEVDVLLINQSGSTGASAHAIATPKVPIEKVKQRVMIMLQAEGDINQEMQKRGRVNRTGQIYKPEYDYVTSAIPAELRLMMMLQRKLKSLDANTTSNQKQSKAMLESPDFLNKYGDKVVLEYLKENPKINDILNDPANLNDEDKALITENLALKVSGRVAILPCKQQQEFYDTILEAYNTQVEYLQQTGYYDLEVEELNLEAETIEKNIDAFGNGGRSAFGGDTYLQLIEANVLKKPYQKEEIEKILQEVLQGQTPENYSKNLVEKARNFFLEKVQRETNVSNEYVDDLIQNIPNEKKYEKAVDKNSYIRERKKELEESREKRINSIKEKNNNEFKNIVRFFNDLIPGKSIHYKQASLSQSVMVPGIFLGFRINEKKENPFAPSAITARLAITDSTKYLELTLSGEQGQMLKSILYDSKGASGVLENWNNHIKVNISSRQNRYVYTGNILQAYSKISGGKLVSYTTIDKKVVKGILMPVHWKKEKTNKSNSISVPLKFCRKAIINLSKGGFFLTDNGLSFSFDNGKMTINTNGLSLSKYSWIVKDSEILQYIIEQGGFQKKSSLWQGSVLYNNVQAVLELIYQKSKANGLVAPGVLELIKDDIHREEIKEKKEVDLSHLKQSQTNEDLEKRKRLVKIKAIAKLKLLQLVVV